MTEQTIVNSYKGILLSIQQEQTIDICDNNMDEFQVHFAKWNKLVSKNYILYDCFIW